MNATSASPNAATTTTPAPRRGWLTTEFWMTLLGHLGLVGAAVSGLLPPQYAALAAAVSQSAYTLSRGLVKAAPAVS